MNYDVIMKQFYCRGKENRISLIEKYEITPVSHLILLNGQTKRSAAEDKITREYYCFIYRKKNSEEKFDTFIVGNYVAKHFLELLNLEPLPLFNILKDNQNIQNKSTGNITSVKKNNWNPLAKELYNIINIILLAWDTSGGILGEILMNVQKYYYKEPFLSNIKSVNTIIGNDNRTIFQMLEFIKKSNDIKEFKFPLIDKILLENKIKNNITGNGI